jgi:hypothetical protein
MRGVREDNLSFLILEEMTSFSPFSTLLAIGLLDTLFLNWGMLFLSLISLMALLWRYVEFCQKICLYVFKLSRNYCLLFHSCVELGLLIYICWTILAFMVWNQLHHAVLPFKCVFELCLQGFYWELLHLCLLMKLVHSFAFFIVWKGPV